MVSIIKIKKITLFILVSILFYTSYGQSLIYENLTQFKWTTGSTINGLNLGDFKDIGLAKLQVPVDSLKKGCTVWTFNENKIIIQKYTPDYGLEIDSIFCSYEYRNRELIIYKVAQDSTIWRYNLGIVSTTNYILLIRKKE